MHCTHGFNRTGYVICAALCRLFAAEGIGADRAVRRFAAARAPGIYKDGYVRDLFWQHHEARPPALATPAVPLWKTGRQGGGGAGGDLVGGGGDGRAGGADGRAAVDDEDDDDKSGNDSDGGGGGGSEGEPHVPLSETCGDAPPGAMHHDDVLGEAVPEEEAECVRRAVYVAVVAARDYYRSGQPPGEAVFRQPARFPGSQPVSLDRRNLELVQARRYLVTWKADGTRYLLLATSWGCYLLDRSFAVRRTQVRFPTLHPPPASAASRAPAHPVGPPHVFTLLDGEMVVDEEEEPPQPPQQQRQQQQGGAAAPPAAPAAPAPPSLRRQRRRYLAYDIMVLNTESVADLKFSDRLRLIEREVERPRTLERQHFARADAAWRRAAQDAARAGRAPAPRPFSYSYEDEAFGVRRKDFWPLTSGERVCRELIPRLCHESDGLILQPADDGYSPYTCEALLKWKFAHLNSVDFVLRMEGGGAGAGGLVRERRPVLLLKGRPRGGGAPGAGGGGGLAPLAGARVSFSAGERPEDYDGRVVECAWDKVARSWTFLRERTDKHDPNAFHVYEKVVGSIEDDIKEADVLAAFARAVANEAGPYGEERRALALQKERRPPPPPTTATAGGGRSGAAPGRAAATAALLAVGSKRPAAAVGTPLPPPPPPPPLSDAPAVAPAGRPRDKQQRRQERREEEEEEEIAAPFVPPAPPTLSEVEAAEEEEI